MCVCVCVCVVCDVMQEFAREVSLRRERLPPEPASSVDPATVVLISLRLPSGERLERRFHNSDQLQVMCT